MAGDLVTFDFFFFFLLSVESQTEGLSGLLWRKVCLLIYAICVCRFLLALSAVANIPY